MIDKNFAFYLLFLFVIYLLFRGSLWLSSPSTRKDDKSPAGRVAYYKKELREWAIISIVLSAAVLGYLPFAITSMEESRGAEFWQAGIFALVCVGVACFFVWMGTDGIRKNWRSLRHAKEVLKDQQDK